MTGSCPKVGRLSGLVLLLSACGSTPVSEATTPTAAAPVHPLEVARRELLTTSPDTPSYTAVMSELRPRIEALDLRDAAPPTSAMTCALARAATPLIPLHASSIILWSGRRSDIQPTDDRVAGWCAQLVEREHADCDSVPTDGGLWEDLCGECGDGTGPSLEARRRAGRHGVAACEAWEHLRSRCAAGEVLSGADALAFAASCRYDAEAVFESASCWVNTPETEPARNLANAIDRLEQLARGEAQRQ